MGWVTLVALPVVILLQAQISFLPYHLAWVVGLQRAAIMADVALIWFFWNRIRTGDDSIVAGVPARLWSAFGGAVTILVVLFSLFVAITPREWADVHLPEFVLIKLGPAWSAPLDWTALSDKVFAGAIDEVRGTPGGLFSNRLVLSDQSFVDNEKIDKLTVARSFRGRDLRRAILTRSDLRKMDFTGADLSGASLESADLREARLTCVEGDGSGKGCASLFGAKMDSADLRKADLKGARLQYAHLFRAKLSNSMLTNSRLQGANLALAQLVGADLARAQLDGADLTEAHLQGANLSGASLRGATLYKAELQGAELSYSQLQGARVVFANVQGVDMTLARLQASDFYGAKMDGVNLGAGGSDFDHPTLDGARLHATTLWRASSDTESYRSLDCRHTMTAPLTQSNYENLQSAVAPVESKSARDSALKRLEILNPTAISASVSKPPAESPDFIKNSECLKYDPNKNDSALAEVLLETACSNELVSEDQPSNLRAPVAAELTYEAANSDQLQAGRFEDRAVLTARFLEGFLRDAKCEKSRGDISTSLLAAAVAAAQRSGVKLPAR